MFVNADVKGLEVVGCAWLSGDPVLRNEILCGEDIHGNNQRDFNLPDRLTSKVFMFRMIYGGTEYSYAKDPQFNWISNSTRFWKQIIDNFYGKYNGIEAWHRRLVTDVQRNSGLVKTIYGRSYYLPPEHKGNYGLKWPITKIKNYPVQGLGADLVAIARCGVAKRLLDRNDKNKMCLSVHDSIVVDAPTSSVGTVAKILQDSVKNVPANFTKIFGVEFDLPLEAEIKVGKNLGELEPFSVEGI